MIKVFKDIKARKIMHQTAAEGMEEICKRIERKTQRLVATLQNGGGEALMAALKKK
jgi:hypothetical protein